MEAELHFSTVTQPINTTVPCPSVNVEDVKTLVKCRSKIKCLHPEIVELTKSLEVEFKLLDTFLYKNHNRFRNDKGYRTTRMLSKTVRKMLDLPFTEKMSDFLQFVPNYWSTQQVRLPTIAMSSYCQALLTVAATFIQKIDHLSRKCGLLSMQRLNLGHFWGVAALSLAIISRIWVICRNILLKLELCFSNLGKINQFLPGVSPDYKLPEHLYQLLDDDEFRKLVQKSEESFTTLSNLTGEAGVSVEDFLDIGEPVKRSLDVESLEEGQLAKKTKVETVESNITTTGTDPLSSIHSIEDFKTFLSEESNLRKTSKKKSFTRKLSQDEWKTLKKEVLRKLNPVIPNKSIKFCRKLIRKSVQD